MYPVIFVLRSADLITYWHEEVLLYPTLDALLKMQHSSLLLGLDGEILVADSALASPDQLFSIPFKIFFLINHVVLCSESELGVNLAGELHGPAVHSLSEHLGPLARERWRP